MVRYVRTSCIGSGADYALLISSYELREGKSVPSLVWAALVWCENHYRVKFNSTGIDVRQYVMQLFYWSDAGLVVRAPDQAPHIRLETASALKVLVGQFIPSLCVYSREPYA